MKIRNEMYTIEIYDEEERLKKRERNRTYYLKHKDDIRKRESFKKAQKNWRQKNREKLAELSRKYREKVKSDPERHAHELERTKQWRQDNPERQRAAQAQCDIRRRLKNLNRILNVGEEEKESIYQFYINCPPGYEVDHIIPLYRGGKHSIDNLQYLLPDENDSKADNWLGIEDEDGSYDPNALIKVEEDPEEFCKRIPKWKQLEMERKRLLERAEEALRLCS